MERSRFAVILLMVAAVPLACQGEQAEIAELLPVRIGGKVGFINTAGTLIGEPKWDYYEPFLGPFADWRNGHLWVSRRLPDGGSFSTFLDRNAQEVTSFDVQWINDYFRPAFRANGTAFVALETGGRALIDTEGKILHHNQKQMWNGVFSEGLVAVPTDEAWGFMDEKGTMVIAASFEDAQGFSDGRAWVVRNGKYGAIDSTGRFVVKPLYDEARRYQDGTAWVRMGGLWGAIDRTGAILQAPAYKDRVYETRGDFAILTSDSMWGLVHARRGIVLARKYDQVVYSAWGREEHFFKFRKGDRWGLLNGEGESLLSPEYDQIEGFHRNFDYFTFRIGGKEGLCDMSGRIVKPPLYDRAPSQLFDGLARYRINGKTGYMDGALNVAIEPQFVAGGIFFEGLACVKVGKGRCGYINGEGELAIPPVYTQGRDFRNGIAAVCIYNPGQERRFLWGAIDRKGAEILPCVYDEVDVKGGIIAVSIDGKSSYADSNGRWIWKPEGPSPTRLLSK